MFREEWEHSVENPLLFCQSEALPFISNTWRCRGRRLNRGWACLPEGAGWGGRTVSSWCWYNFSYRWSMPPTKLWWTVLTLTLLQLPMRQRETKVGLCFCVFFAAVFTCSVPFLVWSVIFAVEVNCWQHLTDGTTNLPLKHGMGYRPFDLFLSYYLHYASKSYSTLPWSLLCSHACASQAKGWLFWCSLFV